MIWHPEPGQAVWIVYAARAPAALRRALGRARADRIRRATNRLAGCTGTVVWAGVGPGPVNAEVLLDPAESDVRVVVPRGNLSRQV